mgnify:CR=1 FL=1
MKQDVELPGLRLITDLFGALMPELPKAYPRHGIGFDIQLDEPPIILFGSGGVAPSAAASRGVSATGVRASVGDPQGDDVLVSLRYTTVVSVLNASADGSGAPLQVSVQLCAQVALSTVTQVCTRMRPPVYSRLEREAREASARALEPCPSLGTTRTTPRFP